MNAEEQYKNYLNKIKFRSDSLWCKPVKNKDNNYYHPEAYTIDEFILKLNDDIEFKKFLEINE